MAEAVPVQRLRDGREGNGIPRRSHIVSPQRHHANKLSNCQVAINADARLVVLGRPLSGNRNGCKA
ncbi:hypothetical protein ACWGMA_09010 [Streptomyces asiaticus]